MTKNDLERFWEEKGLNKSYGSSISFSHYKIQDVTTEVLSTRLQFYKMSTIRKNIEEKIEDLEKYNKSFSFVTEMPGYKDSRTEHLPEYLKKLYAVLFTDINNMLVFINDEEPIISELSRWRLRENV